MNITTVLTRATIETLQTPAEKTADWDSAAYDTQPANGTIRINAQAKSTAGTTPTMLVKLTHCDTSGGSYEDVAGLAGTAVALSDLKWVIDKSKLKQFLKLHGTIGGTAAPSFVVSGQIGYMKKYMN